MFQVNDICRSNVGWAKGVFVITKVTPGDRNVYTGVNLNTLKVYKIPQESLHPKRIGVADADFMGEGNSDQGIEENVSDFLFTQGKSRAEKEIPCSFKEDDKKRWKILAEAKPGENLKIRWKGETKTVKLKYVNNRGWKFVFVATNEKNQTYKYPLSVLVTE